MNSENHRAEIFVPITKGVVHSSTINGNASPKILENIEHTTVSATSRRECKNLPNPNYQESEFAFHQDEWFQETATRMEARRRQFDEEVQRKREEFFQSSSRTPFHHGSLNGSPSFLSHSPLLSEHLSPSLITRNTTPYSDVPLVKPLGQASVLPFLAGDHYERDANGNLYFRLRFDVSEFDVDDIRVTTKEDRLTVSGKKKIESTNASTSKEFTQTLDLPNSIVADNISCRLTDEGILILSAPVVSATLSSPRGIQSDGFKTNTSYATSKFYPYSANYEPSSSQPASKKPFPPPASSRVNPSTGYPPHLTSTEAVANSIVTLPDGRHALQIQINLGDEYQPHEISVKTNDYKLFVHAKHEERSANRTVLKEFSKDFDIPQSVDPHKVVAKFKFGKLHISAPAS